MNRRRKTAITWWVLMVVFAVIAVLPLVLDIDMFDGGGAMLMVGIFMTIMSIVIACMYTKLARVNDTITRQYLAHWEYDVENWRQHIDKTYKERRSMNWVIWKLIAIITAVVSVPIALLTEIVFTIVFCIALLAFLAFVAWLSPIAQRTRLRRNPPLVYIAPQGVQIGNDFHPFNTATARLDEVRIEDGVLYFTYSAWTGVTVSQSYTATVKIPEGKETEAQEIYAYFKAMLENADR